MGTQALVNAACYLAGHDFTADSNELMLTAEGEMKEKTNFRNVITNGPWKEYLLGLKTATLNMRGYWQSASSDAVDPEIFTNLGTADRVLTVAAQETEGFPAAMLRSMPANYQMFAGGIGEVAAFSLTGATSTGPLVRGTLLKKYGSVSATGATGTGVQLGAVGASQFLYATFHVLGTPGTTITAVVESDDNSGFTSATTRITFGPLTTAGGTWATPVAGSITDTWWRVRITAITGTFTIACAVGIQ